MQYVIVVASIYGLVKSVIGPFDRILAAEAYKKNHNRDSKEDWFIKELDAPKK